MEKPFTELAKLVGKVLAMRWLNRNAKQRVQASTESKPHAASSPNKHMAEAVKLGKTSQG